MSIAYVAFYALSPDATEYVIHAGASLREDIAHRSGLPGSDGSDCGKTVDECLDVRLQIVVPELIDSPPYIFLAKYVVWRRASPRLFHRYR